MSSKTVYLKRNGNPTRLNNEMYTDATTRIGARFDGRSPMSAFNLEERQEEYDYLSKVAGIDNNANDFSKLKTLFWNEYVITVPGDEEGLPLEIGTDKDGNPLNLDEYVMYKYALKCNEVAKNKTEADETPHMLYYIYDPEVQMKSDYEKMEAEVKSSTYFGEIKSGKDKAKQKLDHILRVLGISPDKYKDYKGKELRLYEELKDTKRRQAFVDAYEDPDLEYKAMIYELVEYNILQRSGNDFYDGTEELGTVEQVVAKLKNKAETERYVRYTKTLKEAKK